MRDFLSNVFGAVRQSLEIFVTDFILYIPNILAALLVLAVGVWLARVVYNAFRSFFTSVRLDNLFASIGLQKFFHEVGLDFSISRLLAWAFRFFVLFVTTISVLSILKLTSVVEYIRYGIVAFVPTLVTVSLLLFITFLVADRIRELILHSTLLAKNFSPMTARIVWFLIVIVGVLTTLEYLGVAQFLVNLVSFMFVALFAGVALALGLAFGLGAKEEARCMVRDWMGKDCEDLDCGCEHDDNSEFNCCPCDCESCGDECENCSCCFKDKDIE
jgi:hypothetical protein